MLATQTSHDISSMTRHQHKQAEAPAVTAAACHSDEEDALSALADLSVKVIEAPQRQPAAANKAAAGSAAAAAGGAAASAVSYDYSGIILQHPQLSREEKQALLWVLAQCPAYHTVIPSSSFDDHEMPEWVHCTASSSSVLGLDVSRQEPVPPERVHKLRGITTVPASVEVTFDLVTEFEQMQKWDAMLQSMDVLDKQPKQYPVLYLGTFISSYGVPAAVSWLFNDRQFLCRAVAAHFPDGTRALAVYSPPDFTHPLDPGVTKPRTVRAHMGVSGYVVSPFAGEERKPLSADRCQLTMVLQVDPKGGVPLPVYNTVHMMMPTFLTRIKMTASRLKPADLADIASRQEELVVASQLEAARSQQQQQPRKGSAKK